MFIKGKSVVGLDVGSNSLKAVELTKGGHGVEVTGFAQIDLPSEDPDARTEAVIQLIKECGFKTKRVATGVSGRAVTVRYLDMVRMDEDELRHAIRFEAEKFVPTSLDECVLDCQALDAAGDDVNGEVKVLLVAVEKTRVDELIKTVQKAGVTPDVVDVDAFALTNAWCLFTEQGGGLVEGEGGAVALVDVGASKTTVSIVKNGVSVFTREIYLGGNDLTEAVARGMALDHVQAETLKRCPGEQIEQVKDAVFPVLDDIGNELQLSFDYFEGQNDVTIDRILVCGGGSRLVFFQESLEKICEKPVEVFNPFECIPVSADMDHEILAQGGPQMAVAVGLAARLGAN
ncbi:MAG: type IV pilus assembly protein PilM [Planctomycetota bacterium]